MIEKKTIQREEILQLYDQQQRIEIEFPGMRKEAQAELVRFVRPANGMNFISYSRLPESGLDAAIEAQVAFFKPLDQPFSWKVCTHDQPPCLGERLRAHGFQPDDSTPVMVLDLHAIPESLREPVHVDIRPITTRAGLTDVIRVEEQVYGGNFGWIRKRLGDQLEIPGYLNVYVAYVDGQPASTAWTFFYPDSQFVGLYGGSTVQSYRNRRLYTALLSLRVNEAASRGYRYAVTETSPMSYPIVAQNGFWKLTATQDFEYSGS